MSAPTARQTAANRWHAEVAALDRAIRQGDRYRVARAGLRDAVRYGHNPAVLAMWRFVVALYAPPGGETESRIGG